METKKNLYVNFDNVVGHLAAEYGIPFISFDNLVLLGQRAVIVYNLDSQAKRITFDTMCCYISKFISTPFGAKQLYELSKEN